MIFDQIFNEISLRIKTYEKKNIKVVVEQVSAMPGQGVTSMFNFGQSFGILKGIRLEIGLRRGFWVFLDFFVLLIIGIMSVVRFVVGFFIRPIVRLIVRLIKGFLIRLVKGFLIRLVEGFLIRLVK